MSTTANPNGSDHAGLLADLKHQLLKMVAQIDTALGQLPTTTFEITSVRYNTTKHGDPMLNLTASDGTQINAFMTRTRDDFKLFTDAGYGTRFHEMEVFDNERWTQHPIMVEARKPGQWWELVSVHTAAPGAAPDAPQQIESVPDDGEALGKLRSWHLEDEE